MFYEESEEYEQEIPQVEAPKASQPSYFGSIWNYVFGGEKTPEAKVEKVIKRRKVTKKKRVKKDKEVILKKRE